MKMFRTYDPLPHTPKEYRKVATITAVQMMKDFAVLTLEGEVRGRAGDYLAKGVTGELYPIARKIFEKTYEEVHKGD
jgi:hypothetical protein